MDIIVASTRNSYNCRMHRQPRNSWWLFIGLISISVLGWFTNTFTPKNLFIQIIFFFIILATTTSLSLYLLNNVRRALWVGLGVIGFLLLRYVGLREPWYVVLLVASFLSLELFFQKR